MVHGIPVAAVQANLCDIVNSLIWTYYPWGWSIQSLTPTNLNQQPPGSGSPPTGGTNFTGNQQDYTITGAWITFPITLQAGGVTNNNYGGGWPIQKTPNGLSESGTTVTVNTQYPHNLPTGTALAGQSATIVGADVSGYNGTLTITSIPSNLQIIGTIVSSGLAASGGSGNPGILRPLKMRIARLDSNPPEYRELAALGNLSPELSRTAGINTMKAVGWFSSQNFFRLDVSPQVSNGQIIQLLGEYQVLPTKITEKTLSTAFAFPDEYFNVFVEGLKWKMYQLSDDQRAGTIQVSKNGSMMKQYTGQLGVFYEALMQMSRTEDLGSGDEFSYPEEGFGVGRSYYPGIFGL